MGVNQVPRRAELEVMTEDQILEALDQIAERGNVVVGANFWMGELTRVRLENVLSRIASATEENAAHVAEMRDYARAADAAGARMWRLTVANVVLATVATVIALLAWLE